MAVRIRHRSNYIEMVEGRNFWRGVQTLATLDGYAQQEAEALYGQVYPGFSGDYAPICKRVRVELDGDGDGRPLIFAYYETKRQPGKMILQTRTRATWRKIIREPGDEGRVIEGPDVDANARTIFWRVVQGDNQINDLTTVIVVKTAYWASEFDLSTVLSLRRKTNANPLSIVGFGTAAAESLLMLDCETSWRPGDDLRDVDYLLAWSGPDANWNAQIEVEPGVWAPIAQAELEVDYTATGKERTSMVYVPGYAYTETGTLVKATLASEDRTRRLFGTASFGVLQGLTEW